MHKANDGSRSIVSPLTRGALAGVAANWIMVQVTSYLYQHENEAARTAEEEARGGKIAYGVAAEKMAGIIGRDLSDEERKTTGQKIHWALGTGAGAVYGALRKHGQGVEWGQGLAFGTGFFLLLDEIANPVFGFTPGPLAFPWQTHARGFVAHLVFGTVAEGLLGLME